MNKLISKERVMVMAGLLVLLLGVYLVFLYRVQIIEGEEYYLAGSQMQTKEETVVAGVHELPLEVRNWDGTLQQLVDFLHALHKEGAMLAIRNLSVQPIREKQGYLKGSFLLHCAFLRSNAAKSPEKQP